MSESVEREDEKSRWRCSDWSERRVEYGEVWGAVKSAEGSKGHRGEGDCTPQVERGERA